MRILLSVRLRLMLHQVHVVTPKERHAMLESMLKQTRRSAVACAGKTQRKREEYFAEDDEE